MNRTAPSFTLWSIRCSLYGIKCLHLSQMMTFVSPGCGIEAVVKGGLKDCGVPAYHSLMMQTTCG